MCPWVVWEMDAIEAVEGLTAFATKAEALAYARDNGTVTVERVETVPLTRAGVVALFNRRGWCATAQEVYRHDADGDPAREEA
jgi:hypothetical protein